MSSRWERKVLATFFIGSIRERITWRRSIRRQGAKGGFARNDDHAVQEQLRLRTRRRDTRRPQENIPRRRIIEGFNTQLAYYPDDKLNFISALFGIAA
jgi:hypothetical protein